MIDDLDLDALRKLRRIGYYFRYPLYRDNFHDLRIGDQLYGHYAAKPLYGRLTPDGKVDKSAGFNGDVAVLFVPLAAKTPDQVTLLIAHAAPVHMRTPSGKRNWKKINEIAVEAITEGLKEK